MRSDDSMRSDEAVNFFKECLREQGLESVEVSHRTSPTDFYEEFYIKKRLQEDECLSYKTSISISTNPNAGEVIRKQIALEADNIAQEFKDHLVTTFEWDGRAVEVSPYDGGWARCLYCGAKCDAPETQYLITDGCELSDPMPVDRDMSHRLDTMEPHQKILFKMYLIGLLRDECDDACENSYVFQNQKI